MTLATSIAQRSLDQRAVLRKEEIVGFGAIDPADS